MKPRKDYLDVLRAIAMLMVIFQHIAEHASIFAAFTLVIKLPIFFMLSGFLFKAEKSFSELLSNRFRRLLLPVIIFAFLRVIARAGFAVISHHPVLAVIKNEALLLLRGETMWFVPCLFLMEILLYAQESLISRIQGNVWLWRTVTTVVYVAAGYFMLRPGDPLPWHAAEAFIMTAFAQFGRLLREKEDKFAKHALTIGAAFCVLYIAMIFIEVPYKIATIGPNGDEWTCLPLNLLTGCVGITGLFFLVKKLPKPHFLIWIGRNTILFYALHNIIADGLVKVGSHFIAGISMNVIWQVLVVMLLTMLICVPVILFINRFVPVLAGAKAKHAIKNDKDKSY